MTQDSGTTQDRERIRIVALGGSVRPDNNTWRALQVIADELGRDPRVSLDLVDPRELTLALPGRTVEGDDAEALRQRVKHAAGVIVATPEYHGSYSSVIKLVIDNLGFPSVLAGKPVALMGVAAGRIGAIKALEHLRSVLSHVGALVLPNPVSIAGVRDVFDATGAITDPGSEAALRTVPAALMGYLDAHVRPGETRAGSARAP